MTMRLRVATNLQFGAEQGNVPLREHRGCSESWDRLQWFRVKNSRQLGPETTQISDGRPLLPGPCATGARRFSIDAMKASNWRESIGFSR
jgi:hypothetical protein